MARGRKAHRTKKLGEISVYDILGADSLENSVSFLQGELDRLKEKHPKFFRFHLEPQYDADGSMWSDWHIVGTRLETEKERKARVAREQKKKAAEEAKQSLEEDEVIKKAKDFILTNPEIAKEILEEAGHWPSPATKGTLASSSSEHSTIGYVELDDNGNIVEIQTNGGPLSSDFEELMDQFSDDVLDEAYIAADFDEDEEEEISEFTGKLITQTKQAEFEDLLNDVDNTVKALEEMSPATTKKKKGSTPKAVEDADGWEEESWQDAET